MRGWIFVQTIDSPSAPMPPRADIGFVKLLVAVNGVVPLAMLGWDTYRGQLGLNGVNFAIHTTGLLGLIFLLLSLTITPARKLTGYNRLVLLRRTLGLYGFFYLCVHFAIFFVFDRAADLGDTIHEVLTRRYLQIGTASLALLLPLALTSVDAAISWLGAKRWKAIHRLTYAAAVLGALHYCLLVKADLRQPLVFAAVLAALLAFRAVQYGIDARATRARRRQLARAPTPRFWSGELTISRIVLETPDVRTFRLTAVGGGELPFLHRPGQYLTLMLTIGGERVNRSYTIASSPTQRSYCELTVKRNPMGHVSRYLHDTLREGLTLKLAAPAGRFVFTGVESDAVLLLAGGVGVTPLMAMVRYLTDSAWTGQIFLIFSTKQRLDVIFAAELERLQQRFPNLHVCVTLSGVEEAAWTGERGRISRALIERFVPGVAQLPAYLCGPESMMAEARRLLLEIGVPDAQIKTEAFISVPAASIDVRADPQPIVLPRVSAIMRPRPTEFAPQIVSFRRASASTEAAAGSTILEAAEEAGIDLPFECRAGVCGQCKVKLLTGRVSMDSQDALSVQDRANGVILACQARPLSDVAVDA